MADGEHGFHNLIRGAERRPGASVRNVLIVDDDWDFAETMAEILEPHGYVAHLACSFQEARDAARNLDIQVALLDVRLGSASGLDLIALLRRDRPGIICVVLTAYGTVDTAVHALQEGAYDYLRKPIIGEELLATMARCFDKIRLERENIESANALRRSEARLSGILDSAFDAIISIDHKQRIIMFNQGAEKIFGYSAEEAAGQSLAALLPENSSAADGGRGQDAANADGAMSLMGPAGDVLGRRKNGELFPVQGSMSKLEHGGEAIFTAILRDVTRQKHSEAQLEARARQQAAVAQLGQLAVMGADPLNLMDEAVTLVADTLEVDYCKVLEVLPGGEAFLLRAGVGWNEGLVGSAIIENSIKLQSGYTLSSRAPVVVEDFATETRFSRPSILADHGVTSGISIILHGSDQPYGLLGAHTIERRRFTEDDIHFLQSIANVLASAVERKRAEKESQLKQEQLVQADKMASLGVLVAGVAHEVNNPNHLIQSSMLLVHKAWHSIEPIIEDYYLQHGDFTIAGMDYQEARASVPAMIFSMIEGSRRIKNIVEELRNYARETPMERAELVDVNDILKSARALVRNMIRDATYHYSEALGEDLPRIRGNRQRLEQVLINLLQNACQALPEKHKGIHVATFLNKEDNVIVVEVRDEGIGVPEEDLERITDPFFTTKRDSGGTGLGLSISSSIIREHEGVLKFSSGGGEGTVAALTLPVPKYEEQAEE